MYMILTVPLVEVPPCACAASTGGHLEINRSSSLLLVDCEPSQFTFLSLPHYDATAAAAAAAYERLRITPPAHCRSADDMDAQSSSATPGAAVE